ncbi:MAG: radical SAM family heme chaperone HemW [Patescibacteria group bacterium]|jgi:oxygen-independent coproporphyrinogen-3 oxidase
MNFLDISVREKLKRIKYILGQLNIAELQKAGIEREDIKLSSHSHHIVTYPPLSVLPEIDSSQIYSTEYSETVKELALYVHLPFCTGKCLYCSYVSLHSQTKDFIDNYLNILEQEIELLLACPGLHNIKINSLYLGGGTPTYLTEKQLFRLMRFLKSKFVFQKEAEITIEASPETIIEDNGEEKLKMLLQLGVNRFSLGIQTFNDGLLKILGRRHNAKEAIEAYDMIQQIGFDNINIDLIPGLPDETLEIWENDLQIARRLQSPSVTCYPLSIQPTAKIWPIFQRQRERFPSRESVIMMHIMAQEFFNELNYTQRPVWWYIKNSSHVYQQQLYKWEKMGEMLGMGVSSYSFVNDYQYFNFRNMADYIKRIGENKLPILKGIKLDRQNLMRRLIMFGLKTGLDKELFKVKFGEYPDEAFKKTWSKLRKLNLIEESNGIIELSYKGKLFADEVAKEFYAEKIKIMIEKEKQLTAFI